MVILYCNTSSWLLTSRPIHASSTTDESCTNGSAPLLLATQLGTVQSSLTSLLSTLRFFMHTLLELNRMHASGVLLSCKWANCAFYKMRLTSISICLTRWSVGTHSLYLLWRRTLQQRIVIQYKAPEVLISPFSTTQALFLVSEIWFMITICWIREMPTLVTMALATTSIIVVVVIEWTHGCCYHAPLYDVVVFWSSISTIWKDFGALTRFLLLSCPAIRSRSWFCARFEAWTLVIDLANASTHDVGRSSSLLWWVHKGAA